MQLRREGAGTWLIDPVAVPDLSPLEDALGDAEWILHAATQDLPCLAEVGLRPRALFDTELGGRLAGLPRVGLGAMVEHYLGLSLAKEHSAVDWSVRPLPEPWLLYAALDVEVLGDLRDAVAADLESQGKAGWAAEEFAHLLSFSGPEQRTDPWRRTSGMHKVRGRRGIGIVRALWEWRDGMAQSMDVSPGRVLPDAAISEIAIAHQRATAPPRRITVSEPRLSRSVRRHQEAIVEVVARALAAPDDELPVVALPPTGPPPPKAWPDRDPVAAARLARTRELLGAVSTELAVPVENLLTPDLLRRYLWEAPAGSDDGGGRSHVARARRPPVADDDHGAAHLARLHRAPHHLTRRPPWPIERALRPLIERAIRPAPPSSRELSRARTGRTALSIECVWGEDGHARHRGATQVTDK